MSQRSDRASSTESILRQARELHGQGQFAEAEGLYGEVLRAQPDNADALHFLGVLQAQCGRYAQAAELIGRSVALNPNNSLAHYNRGNALRDLKRRDEALACYDRAVAIDPQIATVWSNRGAVLSELSRPKEAIASIDRALALRPNDVTSLYNRGNALRALMRLGDALAMYDRALALAPRHTGVLNARGAVLQDLVRPEEAFAAYEKAHAIDPEYANVAGWRVFTKMQMCDWSNSTAERAKLDGDILLGKQAAAPFVMLAASASPAAQLRCAELHVADTYPAIPEPLWRGDIYGHRKIRIGYVSGEFREQATSYLTADLFECHDRAAFEIYAIATGHDDASPMRKRMENAFDVFRNVSGATDREIAERIRAHEIDLLINLNGYFGQERSSVFAMRPSPVQVNYLGFPGTMGAPYMDYIVADRTIIPEDQEKFYSEQVVYLPETYQPNDRKRQAATKTYSRAECGLPETGLVFCCFNNTHKLTPEIFDIWMRLLKRVEGSALWLLQTNASVRRNLLCEAAKRGVAEDRLVFAPVLKLPDHLARLKLADLVLDTLPHNAHTTASDALWCGVPVLTCLGTTFAGRVAASLVRAAGLPELVMDSLDDYEALALRLATAPDFLPEIKAKLARYRDTCPLFDTPRYTKHLEAAYRTMWERQQRGLAPARFAVERLP